MGVSRCGGWGVRSVLWRRVLAGVRFRVSRGVSWGRGGAGRSVVAWPSCVCALVPVVAPSRSLPRPLVLLLPRPLMVSCGPRFLVPVGACLLPWASPRPLAEVSFPFPCPSLALAFSLPGVGVVGCGGGPVGRRWSMPGGGWCGATGRGFRGVGGGGGPGPRLG